MSPEKVKEYITSLPGVRPDSSVETGVSAYRVANPDTQEDRLFALVYDKTSPLRVSLRCDPNLALVLRKQYETVQPGQNLNRKEWNTVICSGQLTDEVFFDLVRHAHLLVSGQQ